MSYAHDQNDTFTIAALVPLQVLGVYIAVFIVPIPPMKLIHGRWMHAIDSFCTRCSILSVTGETTIRKITVNILKCIM